MYECRGWTYLMILTLLNHHQSPARGHDPDTHIVLSKEESMIICVRPCSARSRNSAGSLQCPTSRAARQMPSFFLFLFSVLCCSASVYATCVFFCEKGAFRHLAVCASASSVPRATGFPGRHSSFELSPKDNGAMPGKEASRVPATRINVGAVVLPHSPPPAGNAYRGICAPQANIKGWCLSARNCKKDRTAGRVTQTSFTTRTLFPPNHPSVPLCP